MPFRLAARRHEPEVDEEAAPRGGLVIVGMPDVEGADQ